MQALFFSLFCSTGSRRLGARGVRRKTMSCQWASRASACRIPPLSTPGLLQPPGRSSVARTVAEHFLRRHGSPPPLVLAIACRRTAEVGSTGLQTGREGRHPRARRTPDRLSWSPIYFRISMTLRGRPRCLPIGTAYDPISSHAVIYAIDDGARIEGTVERTRASMQAAMQYNSSSRSSGRL